MRQPGSAIPRRVAGLLGAALLGFGPTLVLPCSAHAAAVGYVRLAHLSPDTPAVDVYLGAARPDAKPQVFEAVGYGQLSDYLSMPKGRYAVAMRRAGAPVSEPPVLTTEVSVTTGRAYTVAGVGRYADLGLRVLDDDLSAPPAGHAKVRVVQASVRTPVLDVGAADGPTIATGVQFATTTSYAAVRPGAWRLRLAPPGAQPTTWDVRLAGGTVYSLLVLDAERGGLTTELRVDARAGAVVPAGGVATGGGGDAPARYPYPLLAGAATALLAGLALAAVTGVRRARRAG